MKLILAHSLFPVKFKGPWIYLGKNYLRMRHWEKLLSGERISLDKLIIEESEVQKPHIIDWISRQRDANGDSIHWWMTHLAGRNNMSSQFFDYLIQISALKIWVNTLGEGRKDVLVVCEDGFVLKAVQDNLHCINLTNIKAGLWIGQLYDRFYYLLKAFYNLIIQIWWFWSHARMALRTRTVKPIGNQGEICLIHQCLDSKSFLVDGNISCRYFGFLPSWLEAQGKVVIRLPWLFDVDLPLLQVYKKLRESNCLIPEDWLTVRDYCGALIDGYKSSRAILHNVKYQNLDICELINRERYQQLGDGFKFAQFWRYGPALARWGSELKSLIIYDTYEAMPSEHIMAFTGRKHMKANTKFIGYYHSIVTRDFLGYHIPIGEVGSVVYPDLIVTNGSLAKELLISQGLDEGLIKVGPALRQSFTPTSTASRENSKCLLLALSLIPEVTIELLDKMSGIAPWIDDQLGVSVIVKPHPMMKKSIILKIMNWEKLPNKWQWHDGGMHEALEYVWCAVTLNTGSIVDVVAAGCIPFPLSQTLGTPWNYLDILSDDCHVLRAVPDEDIKVRLKEVFISRRMFFKLQAQEAQARLLRGLTLVTDKTMSVFSES